MMQYLWYEIRNIGSFTQFMVVRLWRDSFKLHLGTWICLMIALLNIGTSILNSVNHNFLSGINLSLAFINLFMGISTFKSTANWDKHMAESRSRLHNQYQSVVMMMEASPALTYNMAILSNPNFNDLSTADQKIYLKMMGEVYKVCVNFDRLPVKTQDTIAKLKAEYYDIG